jgi:septal ring factor EnvC (AmiA/AmiB activator)
MPKAVAVVETFAQQMHDVREHAERKFRDDVQTYRAGVQAMAQTGGALPAADADKLLAAAQALGISPDRMADDSALFISISNIQQRIDAIDARNAERREPLARLQSEHAAAKAEWARVKPECDQRLAAAQAAVTKADRALAAVENQRDERADEEHAQIRSIHDRNPHLFGEVSVDGLRRFLAPAQPMRAL